MDIPSLLNVNISWLKQISSGFTFEIHRTACAKLDTPDLHRIIEVLDYFADLELKENPQVIAVQVEVAFFSEGHPRHLPLQSYYDIQLKRVKQRFEYKKLYSPPGLHSLL